MKSMKYPHGKVALFKDRKVIYHLFSDCIVLSPVKSPRFMVKLVKLTNFDPKKCGNLLAKSRKMSTFSSLAANSNAWRVSFFSTHGGPVGWENVDLSHISPISIRCLKMLAFCPRISMAIDINGQIGYQYSWNDAHSKPKTWIRRLGKIEGRGFSNMGRKDRGKIQKTHENWYGRSKFLGRK